MTREQVGQMYVKVSAVYPNTYRGMTELQIASLIDDWYKSLERYPVQICQRAWDKYRNTMKLREMNIAFFVGLIKDILAADQRDLMQEEQRRALPRVITGNSTAMAREECMKKCRQVFGRELGIPVSTEEVVYTYRCPKCLDTGIVSWLEDDVWVGRKCSCDYFDRQRAEYRSKRGDA